jgi:hypothetical protein
MTFTRSLVLACFVSSASACSGGAAVTVDSGAPPGDTGTGAVDTGVPGADGGPNSDAGGDVDTGVVVDAGTPGDAASASCMPFRGRYLATEIRCNGEPFSRMALLTPPAGGWYLEDDGTTATFTQTVTGCSLVATGHIDCDSPVVGQLTHTPDAPLACEPAACSPFAAACTGTTTGTEATWTYVVNADGTVHTETVGETPIQTCTGAGQSNPVQVTWTLVP